ncbi:MAG: peptidoglycan DD-metalloendopeptidase family protein [Candidatus Thermoplasmatota archaeon]|nr:peptidoglycan DD-metalloendopeptidase family protein [Candidatus Thermoplasmatota archaeon]
MPAIDFAAEDWHPAIDLPEFYDVLDLSGKAENVRMSDFSIGKYDEIRNIYTTELFAGGRTLHIGLDIGGPVGTPVMSVADGKIAFSGYNAADGDYGHTVIVHHTIQEQDLWILYGHLNADSTANCPAGKTVSKGEIIAWLGDKDDNGGWPPHLHFQLSLLEPHTHNLPGVVHPDDRDRALRDFPDPRLVLGALY